MLNGFWIFPNSARGQTWKQANTIETIIKTIDMPFDDMRTTLKITVAFSFEIDIQKNVILIHSTVT